MITGGPGAGKTTILLALYARRYAIVGDSARSIIQDRRERGLSPRPDALEFAQEILSVDCEQHAQHDGSSGYVFIERGVVDALCMLDRVAPLSETDLGAWLSKYLYNPKVFVLPPWEAIYANDAERDQTFEQAEAVDKDVQEW